MTTRIVLVSTLVISLLAVAEVLRRETLEPRQTVWFLLLFTLLFLVRVAGQVYVAVRRPGWLPPMSEWNLVPYRYLLPIQLLFLSVMAVIVVGLAREEGVLAERHPSFGGFLIGLAIVYAGAMVVRYAVRMRRRREARWFGGAIPIVFHVVVAAFLFTWGTYHVHD